MSKRITIREVIFKLVVSQWCYILIKNKSYNLKLKFAPKAKDKLEI